MCLSDHSYHVDCAFGLSLLLEKTTGQKFFVFVSVTVRRWADLCEGCPGARSRRQQNAVDL